MPDLGSELDAMRRAIDQTDAQIMTAMNALKAAEHTITDLHARLERISRTTESVTGAARPDETE